MRSKDEDRRVRKTEDGIEDAFIKLLKEKPIQKITVRELTDMADINRATFYTHYTDVYDLLRKMEDDYMKEFKAVNSKHDVEELTMDPTVRAIDLFEYVGQDPEFALALLGPNGDISFIDAIRDELRSRMLDICVAAFGAGREDVYKQFFDYHMFGCIGLVRSWMEDGMKESPEHMGKLVKSIIWDGIEVVRRR